VKGRDREIWVRPPTRGSEPPPAWREALPARLAGVASLALLVWLLIELLIHLRIAGG
jgi:hypothetical protein